MKDKLNNTIEENSDFYERGMGFNVNVGGVVYSDRNFTWDELKKLKRATDVLSIQSKHRELNLEDFFREVKHVGLGKRIRMGFRRAADKKKIKMLMGAGLCVGFGFFLSQNEYPPVAEAIGYIGVVGGGVIYVREFCKAKVAELWVNSRLR